MPAPLDRINHLNTFLVIVSCLLGYLFPWHLLIFSYTVLGPAHYLTQISWLHDRRYFTSSRFTPGLLLVLTLGAAFYPSPLGETFVLAALALALFSLAPLSEAKRLLLWIASLPLLLAWGKFSLNSLLTLGILIPTVIHVFAFTAGFVVSGAMRSQSSSALLTLLAMLTCAASYLLAPAQWFLLDTPFDHIGVELFRPIAGMLPFDSLLPAFGFLSFAYTYHYLNWFSKTRVIPWHKIPRSRAWGIVIAYAGFLGLYAYDYQLGFTAIIFLSLLHVVLEFPLNWRVFGEIGKFALKSSPLRVRG